MTFKTLQRFDQSDVWTKRQSGKKVLAKYCKTKFNFASKLALRYSGLFQVRLVAGAANYELGTKVLEYFITSRRESFVYKDKDKIKGV